MVLERYCSLNETRQEISADGQPMVVSFFISFSFFMTGREGV